MVVSEIKILYKNKTAKKNRIKISTTQQARRVFMPYFKQDIEHVEMCYALMLNASNECLGVFFLSRGGLNACLIDPKLIFQAALKCNASSFVLAHNHPSGNLQESETDIEVTKKIKKAGEIMEIPMIDHLILTKTDFKSIEI